jgi:hypothetical protein
MKPINPDDFSPLFSTPAADKTISLVESPSPEPSPTHWSGLMTTMAQDMRHDLPPDVYRLWKARLAGIPDETICAALLSGRWTIFPSVGQVLDEIDAMKRLAAAQREDDYVQWKREQEAAAAGGKLATEEDYAWMRSEFYRIFGVEKQGREAEARRQLLKQQAAQLQQKKPVEKAEPVTPESVNPFRQENKK